MLYRIAIAGSTAYTVQLAQALMADSRFEVAWTLSPTPKSIGKQKSPSKNPLHQWSEQQRVTTYLVDTKITPQIQQQLAKESAIDFLLVVDFGYFIPTWLLALPKRAPLNIHPSRLPDWRGSSPGQFVLLHRGLLTDSQSSAISLMIMNEHLDQGPLLAQVPVVLRSQWTARDYYDHCFTIMANQLGEYIAAFAQNQLTPTPQPLASPTITARKLAKSDSYLDWQWLQAIILTKQSSSAAITSKLLPTTETTGLLTQLLDNSQLCPNQATQLTLLRNASHAFWPWPGLWTIVPTLKGQKRMKIMPFEGNELDLVQIEGKTSCLWRECRNSILT